MREDLFIYAPERFKSLFECWLYGLTLGIKFNVVYNSFNGFMVKCLKSDTLKKEFRGF